MKQCGCGASNPGFSSRCVQCSNPIDPSTFAAALSAPATTLQASPATHGTGPAPCSAMKATVPHAASAEARLLQQLRDECVEYYDAWAETIAAGFPRQELESYLDSHLPVNGSLARAHQAALQLITLIDSRTGMRAKFAQQKQEAGEPQPARLSHAG